MEQSKEGNNFLGTKRFITKDLESYSVGVLIVRGTYPR